MRPRISVRPHSITVSHPHSRYNSLLDTLGCTGALKCARLMRAQGRVARAWKKRDVSCVSCTAAGPSLQWLRLYASRRPQARPGLQPRHHLHHHVSGASLQVDPRLLRRASLQTRVCRPLRRPWPLCVLRQPTERLALRLQARVRARRRAAHHVHRLPRLRALSACLGLLCVSHCVSRYKRDPCRKTRSVTLLSENISASVSGLVNWCKVLRLYTTAVCQQRDSALKCKS